VCTCAQGYADTPTGTCFTELDECSSDPCLHSGTCFDHVFSYSCICARGFSGYNCEVDDDDCMSSPCKNGSTCTDMVDKYTCTCRSSWAGAFCDVEVDACIAEENNCDSKRAECIHVGVGYHECVCNAGYETSNAGVKCSNILECSSSPCLNGGTCADGKCTDFACEVQYSCSCHPGWAGDHCEFDLNECASYPCINGATCLDGTHKYTCVCGAGFDGSRCQVDVNECKSAPCLNAATCLESGTDTSMRADRYRCVCVAGFTGIFCQTDINECDSRPCLHGGTCTQGVNSYTCTCSDGYKDIPIGTCYTELD